MKNTTSKLLMLGLAIGLLSGCVSETYKAPEPECIGSKLTKTKEVADLYAIAINPTGTPQNTPTYGLPNATPDYIEGYIISSDEGGNFYQNLYVSPKNDVTKKSEKGFNVSVDIKFAYANQFAPGTKVYLKLNGLAFGNPTTFNNGLTFGAPPTDKFPVDRLKNYETNLFPSCEKIDEDAFVIKELTIADLTANDNYLNTLVEIKDAQFDDVTAGGTYDFNRTNGFDDNTYIKDSYTASTAPKLAVRTSRFANFAGFNTPTKNGTIRGVLTKYVSPTGTFYQLVLRTLRDVKMNKPRVLPPSNPIGGTNLIFDGSLTENFTSFSAGNNSFNDYINDRILGNKYWKVNSYGGNNYIEMSAYGGAGNPGIPSTAYFMVPVDFTAASTLSFKKEARYNYGPCLKVYYLKFTDYVPGLLKPDLFTDITSSFTLTYPAIGASENAFTNAGTYNIDSSLTGNGFFIFEYTGTTTVTTTMQLDDIVIN